MYLYIYLSFILSSVNKLILINLPYRRDYILLICLVLLLQDVARIILYNYNKYIITLFIKEILASLKHVKMMQDASSQSNQEVRLFLFGPKCFQLIVLFYHYHF